MDSQKIILITGANTGLGREIVEGLLQSNIAHSILVGSRNLDNAVSTMESLTTEYPNSESLLFPLQIDIEDDISIDSAFAHVSGKFGRLDGLVNNAGAQFDQLIQPGKMTVREAWNMSWNVNTVGTHVMTLKFVPLLLKSPQPRLLFITSSTSTLAGSENTAIKTGMNMLMREWHRTLLEDGVKTWCISPGYLATGLGGNLEVNKKQGALDPSVGASLVRKVLEGERDGDVGKVVSNQGIQEW
ncbi:hypothetical protein QQX98_000407 [Neonectria punicea]|uniref:Uncharacterized protein n=1 Tax=Neonectria punicea TaxID=979145 RepID=A0ABR1HUD7_9HYPO